MQSSEVLCRTVAIVAPDRGLPPGYRLSRPFSAGARGRGPAVAMVVLPSAYSVNPRKWRVTGMARSAVADRNSMEIPARSRSAGPEHIPRRASRMSSAGQPENNDLTRRQGFEVRVRHPAGGASLRRLLRAARRGRRRLSRSQRHVLAAIQNELQADADLAASFSAFASVTLGTAMPKAERLPARGTLPGWRRGWRRCWRHCWRALLNRRIMPAVAVVAALAAALAVALAVALTASSPGGQTPSCHPVYAVASVCSGSSSAPAGVGGPLQASDLPHVHGGR
jgi:hypothetical protein